MTQNTIALAKKASKAEHIIERLEACGYRAYIVGGAVRDMILDESILDFDIVTNASLNEIQAIFNLIHKKKKVKKVGSTFKICIVNDIEVAASRSDDLQSLFPENDLGKRDFTMNSMAYDLFSDKIIDPFSGQEDLKKRVIRFTKSPEMRIKEDPLRMVRACRFVSKINGKIDSASLDAIKKHKDLIPKKVAMERVRLEILKAMEYEKPSMFFQALHRSELLEHIFPSLDRCFDLDGGPHHGETVFEHCMLVGDALSPQKPLLRLAGYLHDAGKYDAAEFKDGKLTFPGHEKKKEKILADLKNLKFSREEIEYIDSIITVHMRPLTDKSTPKAVRRILVLLEKHQISYHDFLRMRIADKKSNLNPIKRAYTLSEIRVRVKKLKNELSGRFIQNNGRAAFSIKDLEITGTEVMTLLNISEGPLIGEVMEFLFEKVLDNPCLNSSKALKKLVLSFQKT